MNQETPGTVWNPFLPSHEFVADGEPHVFGDRVYLFGSHDQEGGDTYCALDYVFYSVPVDDLTAWSSKGVNYRAVQDPAYAQGRRYMYAPDVVRGNDGRFYLYYCMSGEKGRGGYAGPISVAVADEPDGSYEYLGYVRNADGSPFDQYVLFDPAVINDDGTIRLYYGASFPFDDLPVIARPLTRRILASVLDTTPADIKRRGDRVHGAITVRLGDDMLTVQGEPARIIPTATKGTSFAGHAFFEGSSIRKIGDIYYFVYSSWKGHELCYATSEHPDRAFVYRGTIVSTGDIGLGGRKPKDRINQTGTNHGGIEQIAGRWYVFYHRNTHGSLWSRQACAEPITIQPDGSIPQVAVTSTGLNPGPLPARGTYPATICSQLTRGRMGHGPARLRSIPVITHDDSDRFVGRITSGTVVGFKHFAFDGPTRISITTRGTGRGRFDIATQDGPVGSIPLDASSAWTASSTGAIDTDGSHELYLQYVGDGRVDLLSLGFDAAS
jgi:hypothetical protein